MRHNDVKRNGYEHDLVLFCIDYKVSAFVQKDSCVSWHATQEQGNSQYPILLAFAITDEMPLLHKGYMSWHQLLPQFRTHFRHFACTFLVTSLGNIAT